MTDRLRSALGDALAEALHRLGIYCQPTIGSGGTGQVSRTLFECSPRTHMGTADAILAHPAVRAALRPLLDVVEAAQEFVNLPPYTPAEEHFDALRAALDAHLRGDIG